MAQGKPPSTRRWRVRAFCRRRQRREKYQPESGAGASVRPRHWRRDRWHRRPRRWLHRHGCGRVRDRADRQSRDGDAAQRSLPGGDLALARVASAAQGGGHEMGIGAVKRPAIFLDRDGVLNRTAFRDGKPMPPQSLDELEILPGVPEALVRLKAAGYSLVVVTNQPDVARGVTTKTMVDGIHRWLAERLPIDEIRVCLHDDQDECDCRKPKPGLLLASPNDDVRRSIMIGDRWRDIEAGRAAGCRATILIDYGYDEDIPNEPTG